MQKQELNIMLNEPCCIEVEINVMALSLQIIDKTYKSRFKTSIDDDKGLLKDNSLSSRMQFAVLYRLNAKELFKQNIHYITTLQQILNKVKLGSTIKEAYMCGLLDGQSYLHDLKVFRYYLMNLCVNTSMLIDKAK